MRVSPCKLIVLLVCMPTTVSCATSIPTSAPQLAMPLEAKEACSLYRLPPQPTQADLEIGYATRGAQLVACDLKRKLAVTTHEAEHAMEQPAPRRRFLGLF